jgi:hypothetical protein
MKRNGGGAHTVNQEEQAEFVRSMKELAAQPVGQFVFTAAKFACFFMIASL